jgi:hypothetical protein
VLHFTRLERLAVDKHSSLSEPFVHYEESEVLPVGPHFILQEKLSVIVAVIFYVYIGFEFCCILGRESGTVVEHSTQDPKTGGSNTEATTKREKFAKR